MFNSKIQDNALTPFAKKRLTTFVDNANGKVGVPILLYFLGVPGVFVVLLWAVFFRGK